MTLNTTAGNTPLNTMAGNRNNNTIINNTQGKDNNKKKKKKYGKGNRNGKQNTTETKFEGLLKEENFKGVVIKYGKSAIQSRLLRLAATTHVNAKNQPFVVNLITFKEPITVKQFVNTRENPINP